MIEIILGHEGGYVNDKADSGGETNWGISKRAFPDVDIKNLTKQQAKNIYRTHYFVRSRAKELPSNIRLTYFDMCVNMGQRRAVKILQKAINGKGKYKVEVDGRIGPNTIRSSKGLENERLKSYKVLFYAEIVIRKPSQEKFWFGWYRRGIYDHKKKG
tara:strand:- start:827 stop:1300 length:474 start_codon:yes stop_codon:yes gene_type:complete